MIIPVTTLIVLFGNFVIPISGKLGCRNENGASVDWYILYKLPRESKSSNPQERVGEAYAILDSTKGAWILSDKSVEDPTSYIAATYLQVIDGADKQAYLVYNDQMPNSNKSSSSWGHTKGVLSTDGTSGFWLVHSVPRFPLPPSDGKYDYPENAKEHAQSLLCISFSFDQLPVIVNLFRYTHPNVYARNSNKAVDALPESISNFFSGKPTYVKKEPFNITSLLTSSSREAFTVFGKHKKWGKDLYDGLVAPTLASSLNVQSWQVGAGTPLTPDCRDPFLVYNVEALNLNYGPSAHTSFETTDDHSKWAASQVGFAPWVCIGDINRMESQFKRGGGTVCLKSAKTWKAFNSTIVKYEGCPSVRRLTKYKPGSG